MVATRRGSPAVSTTRFTRRTRFTSAIGADEDENDDEFTNENENELDDAENNDEPSEEYEEDIHDRDVKSENGKGNNDEHTEHQEDHGEDEDEDADIRPHRTRRHKNINYNEDSYLKALDEEVKEEEEEAKASRLSSSTNNYKNDGDDEDDYGDQYAHSNTNGRRSLRRKRSHKHEDDDDYDFNGDAIDTKIDDDEFVASDGDDDDFIGKRNKRRQRQRQNNFIVNDDYEVDENESEYENSRKSRRSTRNSRTRSHQYNMRSTRSRNSRWNELLKENENPDSPVTLEDELKDLQNDSPLNSPKRNLRNRKDVNYKLPPPYLSEAQLEELENNTQTESSPRKGRSGRYGGSTSNVSSIRRLYSTVGPFGGSDVHSLFQSNSIPSGLAVLANAESSDSDDENDLIKPTDPNDTNIITTAINPNSTNKKKNSLADTDPLGIDTNIDFSVVGGLNNYINQLKEMVTLPLLYPEVYSKFHITPPRGVLFHGPPGTGKTLMARALSASCSSQNKKITFFMRKGADCLSKWVGEAERHLRLLFEEAKQHQPSIIFFDEIDGLAPVRSSKQEQIHASIVSTLLALMDGMDNRGQVIIIGATNRPDSIDPALRRPGRFDREFYFPLPDLNARKEILNIHMRKWEDKLNDEFITELAKLTKGYGGADLRALCTESALNSIQRTYPQIYQSNEKLKINLSKIKPIASDFTKALQKIIPSSARSVNNIFEPLPDSVKPLLHNQFLEIMDKLTSLLPNEKELTLLEESKYETLNNNFQSQQIIKNFDSMRIYKPRFGIFGSKTQGLTYLSNSVLNKLEGFTVQILDLGKIFSDSSISVENVCIQLFSELKRHKPSILFIPDTFGFLSTINESLKSTIRYLIRNINNNDKVLIYCEFESSKTEQLQDYLDEIEEVFGITEDNIIMVNDPTLQERDEFFQNFWKSIYFTPNEYNDIQIRPKRKEITLEVVKDTNENDELKDKLNRDKIVKTERELAKNDMRLKNSLKVKLSGLLDIFKVRYKRFKKPIIDDSLLIHLFETDGTNVESNYQIKDDQILEISTNKLYYNMDLDVIEERLWNGYYSEPKQFLHDLSLILKDANLSNEKDRILKANEMYAHAVVGVEEIEVQFPLLAKEWKEVSKREKQRKIEYLEKSRELKALEDVNAANMTTTPPVAELEGNQVNGDVINGDEKIIEEDTTDVPAEETDNVEQVQAQSQIQPGQESNLNGDIKDVNGIRVEPVVLNEPVEKIEVELQVENLKENDEINTDVANVEKEQEEEFVIEPQYNIVNVEKVKELENLLLKKTEGFHVSKLERINSKLCNIVWNHRLSLDKGELISELEKFILNSL